MGKVVNFFTGDKGDDFMSERVTVFDVADYFLKVVDRDSGGSITHLKLQKLVYYAQAWNLVFEDEPLFDSEIQAWVHGPVCPKLYNKYSGSGFDNLPEPINVRDVFTPGELETLEAVWECYGDYDGKYLEQLTHQEQPWIEARQGCAPGEHCTTPISLATMREYYTRLSKDGQKN